MSNNGLYPPSVIAGIPKLSTQPTGWQRLKFADVLKLVERPLKLEKDKEYKLLVAKRNRGGIVLRSNLKGKDIKTKTQFLVAKDDFLISKRQIVHGACGIVPPELDGAVVSNEYVSFTPKDLILLEYLKYFSFSSYFQQTCFQASVGVDIEKMIFRTSEWLKYEFYLPPVKVQNKTIAFLRKYEDLLNLLDSLIKCKEELRTDLSNDLFLNNQNWNQVPLEQIINIEVGGTPSRKVKEFWDTNKSTNNYWLSIRDLSNKYIYETKEYITELGVKKARLKLMKAGTVVMSFKLTIGKTAILGKPSYTNEAIASFLPKEEGIINNNYLYHALGKLKYEKFIDQAVKGKTLNKSKLNKLSILLPPLIDQKRIADVLDKLDDELQLLKEKNNSYKIQMKGFMNLAFKGELLNYNI